MWGAGRVCGGRRVSGKGLTLCERSCCPRWGVLMAGIRPPPLLGLTGSLWPLCSWCALGFQHRNEAGYRKCLLSGCGSEHTRGRSSSTGVRRTSHAQDAERPQGAPDMAELGRRGPSVQKPASAVLFNSRLSYSLHFACFPCAPLGDTNVSTEIQKGGVEEETQLDLGAKANWCMGGQPWDTSHCKGRVPSHLPPTRPSLVLFSNSDKHDGEHRNVWQLV